MYFCMQDAVALQTMIWFLPVTLLLDIVNTIIQTRIHNNI